jgi:diguanylate cyclase (GGDEF)-like protein
MRFARPGVMMTSKRLKAAVLASVVAIVATFWIAAAVHIDRTWRSSWERAESEVERLGRTAEGILNRQLLQVDAALATLPLLLGGASADAVTATRLLRSLNFQHFAYRDLILLRADGQIIASARGASRQRTLALGLDGPRGNVAPGTSLLMGPLRNAATGDWSIYVVRPLAGSQAGLFVAAEVPISTLTSPLASVGDSPGTTLRLERADGTLVAALPHDELRIGRLIGLVEGRRSETPQHVQGQAGQAATLSIWRPSLHADLGLSANLDVAVALEDWSRDRNHVLLIAALASAMIALVAGVFLTVLRRQERLETERLNAQSALTDAIEVMSDGFVMWDADDRLVTCNASYLDLYDKSAPFIKPGVPFREIMRKGAENGQYPQAEGDIDGFIDEVTRWRRTAEGSLERLLPDGRWLLITERRTRSGGFVGIRTDITPMKTAMSELAAARDQLQSTMTELQQQNRLFDAALNNMSQGLLMGDASGQVIVCNGRFKAMFGLAPAEAVTGLDLQAIFGKIRERPGSDTGLIDEILARQLALSSQSQGRPFVMVGTDRRAFEITHLPMPDGGFVATYEEVSEQYQIEQQMRYQASHDALTGLLNRRQFREELVQRLGETREQGTEIALLYLDLDRFKEVNDTLGHPVGDALLVAASERIRACLRGHDLVARLGGDEFALAIVGRNVIRLAEGVGARILAEIGREFSIHGQRITVGVSIGAAIGGDGQLDADELLQHADLALYEAKAHGRGCYRLFAPHIAARLRDRIDLESELRQAVEAEAFELAYQPIFSLDSRAVRGFEALLRWNHPSRGAISPAAFLPIAEEIGLIGVIGAFVLRRACRDAMLMPGASRMAVNVSPTQLIDGGFTDLVIATLGETGLPPERLELEITETALLADDERILAQLRKLRHLGVRIALDDFGVGYSSLNYIRRVPLSKIKIDQVFVREAIERPDCRAIIQAVVDLAGNLGIATTAEGIETPEQMALLREIGCDEGQGYLLGRPGSLLNACMLLGARVPERDSDHAPSERRLAQSGRG